MAAPASPESLCKIPPVSEVEIESSGANVQSNEPTVADPRNGTAPTHPANSQVPSDDSCKKPQLSQRKIEANRQNSCAATGPKTLEGKRNSSRNALKHGLFAAEVVNLVQGESLKLFRQLLQDLLDEYQPVGCLEKILVEKIAGFLWRQSRILSAENGASSKALVAARKEAINKINQFTIDLFQWELMWAARELKVDLKVPPVEPTRNLRRTAQGIGFVVLSLKAIKKDIEKTGLLPEGDWTLLVDCLGPESVLMLPVKTADGIIPDGFDLKAFLKFLDHQISWMETLKNYTDETENIDLEAAELRTSVPLDATEKLDRHEAHLERHLYRAMAELDRLQMRRKGEAGPPEVRVHLTREV
jgi:hypothetical protein